MHCDKNSQMLYSIETSYPAVCVSQWNRAERIMSTTRLRLSLFLAFRQPVVDAIHSVLALRLRGQLLELLADRSQVQTIGEPWKAVASRFPTFERAKL